MAERNDANDRPRGDQQQGGQQQGGQQQGGEQEAAREGHSERAGEGGYGNDTGFATGTQAPRDQEQGGTSAREEQTSNTYRDTGQGRGER